MNSKNWGPHRFWIFVFLFGTLGSATWFFAASQERSDWAGGSTQCGFVLGVALGLICLFEFFLWFKKKVRVWRIGTAQAWMRAHIWLGLLCVPLLFFHGGLRFGGPLTTTLSILLLIIVASGVVGLTLHNLLPRRMLDEVPKETVFSQIQHMGERLQAEGARLVGTISSDAEPLSRFFRDTLTPYLLEGKAGGSSLSDPRRAAVLFQSLRTEVPPGAHFAVDQLEDFCEQRRQWDRQAVLHFWLHSWLWIHFPLSVALMVLMFVHVWVALRFY